MGLKPDCHIALTQRPQAFSAPAESVKPTQDIHNQARSNVKSFGPPEKKWEQMSFQERTNKQFMDLKRDGFSDSQACIGLTILTIPTFVGTIWDNL